MRQTILTVVLIFILAATGVIWYRYLRRPATGAGLSPASLPASQRLAQYRELQTLAPDLSIFSGALFRSLQRPAAAAPAGGEPKPGRPNPFAPF